MIFAVIGILKPSSPPNDPAFEAALNEHLAQPAVRIANFGFLRNAAGAPFGLMGLIDVETEAQARAYLAASPFSLEHLYQQVHLGVYDIEVGRIG